MKNNEIEKTNSRRSFMKKAAYAVPTIIAISQLTNPTSAEALKKDTASTVRLAPATKTTTNTNNTQSTTQGISASSFN